jgi:hypothetical protein
MSYAFPNVLLLHSFLKSMSSKFKKECQTKSPETKNEKQVHRPNPANI